MKKRSGVDASAFRSALSSQLNKMGCTLPQGCPEVYADADADVESVQDLMQKAVNLAMAAFGREKPELLIVVLPDGGGEVLDHTLILGG